MSDPRAAECRSDKRVVLLDEQAERSWVMRTPGRPWLRCSIRDWRAADDWLNGVLGLAETRQVCAEWAGERLGLEKATIFGVSAPLHDTFAKRLHESAGSGARQAVDLCTELLGWTVQSVTERFDRWAAYAALLPADGAPLWIMDADTDTLEPTLDAGDRLSGAGIPVGLRVTPEMWFQFKSADTWDRCATRWKLAPVLSSHLPEGVQPIRTDEVRRIVQNVAPEALSLLEKVRIDLAAVSVEPEAAERARSAAEALLFAVLEARPATKGRFVPNAPLDFSFGTRIAEGDLTAVDARIVVEIDGYYHFRDAEGYRRDRRKDVMLQEHGWFVMRFLAEDVVSHLETVLQRIEQTLVRRDAVRLSQYKP